MAQRSVSPGTRVLQSLHGRGRLCVGSGNVLVSSTNPLPLCLWAQGARRGAHPRKHIPSNHKSAATDSQEGDEGRREAFAYDVLASLRDHEDSSTRRRAVAADVNSQIVVAPPVAPYTQRMLSAIVKEEALAVAPFSMLDLAGAVCGRAGITRRRYVEETPGTLSLGTDPLVMLPASSTPRDVTALQRARALEESTKVLCPSHSFDLVVVEVGENEAPVEGQQALQQPSDAVAEAILCSPHLLTSSGTLVAVFPQSTLPLLNTGGIARYTKWRFREAFWASRSVAGTDGFFYLFCSGLAGDSEASLVDDSAYPGFLSSGTRRMKHWNPRATSSSRGGRCGHKGNFVASLRPSFTNAEHIRDALQASMEQEEKSAQKLRDDDDAFFDVAHEMVEKGWHYKKPEN